MKKFIKNNIETIKNISLCFMLFFLCLFAYQFDTTNGNVSDFVRICLDISCITTMLSLSYFFILVYMSEK